jgi:hypothetical protein
MMFLLPILIQNKYSYLKSYPPSLPFRKSLSIIPVKKISIFVL